MLLSLWKQSGPINGMQTAIFSAVKHSVAAAGQTHEYLIYVGEWILTSKFLSNSKIIWPKIFICWIDKVNLDYG